MKKQKEMLFPRSLASTDKKLSPLEKFFASIARRVDDTKRRKSKIDVTAVSINPEDSQRIKKELKKWLKLKNKGRSADWIEEAVAWVWFGSGPVENENVSKGKCLVDTKNLFVTPTYIE